jgi:hypothetical protein
MRNIVPAVLLVLAGLALILMPLPWTEGYSSSLGLSWSVRNMEVVLVDRVDTFYIDVVSFRQSYPMYSDLADDELARRLHERFLPDEKFEAFSEQFLPAERSTAVEDYRGKPADPLGLRGEAPSLDPMDVMSKALLGMDAQNHGLVKYSRERKALPYLYAALPGLLFLALGTVILLRALKGGKAPKRS